MAAKIRSSVTGKKAAATTLATTLPAGAVNGDLGILVCTASINTGVWTAPTGWTLLEHSEQQLALPATRTYAIFTRELAEAGAGKDLPTLAYSVSTTLEFEYFAIEKGTYKVGAAIDSFYAKWEASAGGGELIWNMPGLTTVAPGCAIVAVFGQAQEPASVTGFAKVLAGTATAEWFDAEVAASGATGTFACKKGTKVEYVAFLFAIAPSIALRGKAAATAVEAGKLEAAGVPKGKPNAIFGKSAIGATATETMESERERMMTWAAPAGEVIKLSFYFRPGSAGAGTKQKIKGLIYADAAGKPGALLGSTEQIEPTAPITPGWVDLIFATPVAITAGTYWIGVMTGPTGSVVAYNFDASAGARQFVARTYASGPFAVGSEGVWTTDTQQSSCYATLAAPAATARAAMQSPPLLRGAVASTVGALGKLQSSGILRVISGATSTWAGKIAEAGLKGLSSAVATMAGRLQAPGVEKGSSAATATDAGRLQAPGVERGSFSSTATSAARAQAPGVPKASSSATSTEVARGNAPGALHGSSSATATWLARLAGAAGRLVGFSNATGAEHGRPGASGALRVSSAATSIWNGRIATGIKGVSSAVATMAGRLQAPASTRASSSSTATSAGKMQATGSLRGPSAATATLLGRLAGVAGRLLGKATATATAKAGLQAPGKAHGASVATATAKARAGAPATLLGRTAATLTTRGLAGATGFMRGAWEAVGKWFGKLSIEGAAASHVEVTMEATVSTNVRLEPVVEVSTVLEPIVSVNARLEGSGR